MPRTLPAELTAALDSGNFQAYFLLTVREVGGAIIETAQPTYFKLAGINLSLKWPRLTESVYVDYDYPHELEFMVTRGVTIAGVNYTIDSSYYYGVSQGWNGIYQTIEACMFPAQRYTAAADVTYKTVIDAICTAHGKTAVYETVGAAWQSYQFLGDGKTITLNRASDILNWLKQKYLIYACDNGDDEILFKAIGTDPIPVIEHHEMQIGLFKNLTPFGNSRRFLYRDENNTIHYDGNAADPLWNLGYLESTASPPGGNFSQSFILEPIAPHLKYLGFDRFRFTFENYPNTLTVSAGAVLEVIEEYNNQLEELGWRILLESFDWAKGTEGGALPSTIEAAAPYTPLNTSNFDGLLDANINNIQTFADKVDELFDPFPGSAGQYLGGDGLWHFLPSSVSLFLDSTNSDVSGYETLTHNRPTGGETTAAASIAAADTEIEQFIHAAGEFDFIAEQILHCHIHLAKTAGVKNATAYVKVFHRTSGGTETLLGTSASTDNLTGSSAPYDFDISIADTDFAATDRLVLKVYASPNGAGTDPTVTLYFQGATDSRIEVGTDLDAGGLSFNDAEGAPANLSGSSNQDGTSAYAARRDHAHQGFNDSEGDPAAIGTTADGTSAYAARRDHVHATVNGSAVLSGGFTITGADGTYQDTGLSITLPSAGTYKIDAAVYALIQSAVGAHIVVKLYNSTDSADVANSETLGIYAVTTGIAQNQVYCNALITVAASKTIKLYAYRNGGGGSYTVSAIGDGTTGRTRINYLKVG